MLGLTVLLLIPSYALQLLTARETGEVRGDPGAAGDRLAHRMRQALIIAVPVTAALLMASGPIADALNMRSAWPVVLTALSTPPMLVMTVMRGAFQGTGRYGALSANLITEAVARLGWTVAVLPLGGGATGVTAAPAVGAAVGAIGGAWALRATWRARSGRPRATAPAAAWATTVFFGAFAMLTNTDVLIAKHALDDVTAGEYAAAALFGKIVLFLPVAVGIVLVAETSARRAAGQPTLPLLSRSLALVVAACGAVAAVAEVSPGLVAALTVGEGYDGALPFFAPYALAMLGYAVVNVLASYTLALGQGAVAWACAALAPLQAAAQFAVRDRPEAIIWTMVAAAAAAAAVGGAAVVRGRPAPPVPAC